jgi:hypothetical protein
LPDVAQEASAIAVAINVDVMMVFIGLDGGLFVFLKAEA